MIEKHRKTSLPEFIIQEETMQKKSGVPGKRKIHSFTLIELLVRTTC